jgi:tRNA pseudouridine55 synthase/H/ACA ribonucleoprotein complex subunit 4
MGFSLGVGAHMQELRRSRSGAFDETTMHTLHEIKDACVAAEGGNRTALESMVMSVDAAVPDLPVVIVRDTAIDAICRGALLAGVGVISCDEFKKNQTVAVLSQKREFVCLGKALVPSSSFKPGDTGLVIAPTAVFLQPGTYPRGWTKSDKPVKHDKKPAKKPVSKPARRTSVQFQKKRYP